MQHVYIFNFVDFFYLSAQWLSHVGVPRIVVVTFDILNRQ